MSNFREIDFNEQYIDNIVWGSIDPNSGDIVLYPVNISDLIEQKYKKEDDSIHIAEYFDIRINFKRLYQTTKTGFRHVFRTEVESNSLAIVDKNNLNTEDTFNIKMEVNYNDYYKAWYSTNKISHIGFNVDTSGSMYNIYNGLVERGIEHFLEEQKTINNDINFYGMTFSNLSIVHYNAINLKDALDIREKFYSITPRGGTAWYDSIIKMISIISDNYIPGDEVVICSITDGEDNQSRSSKDDMNKLISEKKEMGWLITVIGANNYDAESSGNKSCVGRNSSLNAGTTEKEQVNAFRSVTESVRRVRTGESNDIIYTQFERTSSSNTTSHTGLKRS